MNEYGVAPLVESLRYNLEDRQFDLPIGSLGFFIFHYFGPTMVLGSTQPLAEMSTRGSPGSKCGRCVGLTTFPPSCADSFEIWGPQFPGSKRACPGL